MSAAGKRLPVGRVQRVHFVPAIPKTSVGKLDKKAIRAKLAAREYA